MNKHTAQEQAYKNGYTMGLRIKQGKYAEQFIKGLKRALNSPEYTDEKEEQNDKN